MNNIRTLKMLHTVVITSLEIGTRLGLELNRAFLGEGLVGWFFM